MVQSTATTMIGPPPTFYDGHGNPEAYDQWAQVNYPNAGAGAGQQQYPPPQQQQQYGNSVEYNYDYSIPPQTQQYQQYYGYAAPPQQHPPHPPPHNQQQQQQYQHQQQPPPPPTNVQSTSHHTPVPVPQRSPTGPHRQPKKRKRPEERVPTDDRSEDEQQLENGGLERFLENGGISVGMGGLGIPQPANGGVGRLPGACSHCKKLKMKCEFRRNENTCRRCASGGHVCIVEGRKPRTAPNKREYLLAQIRQKDAIIESLLKQLHNPYLATPLSIASYRMATSPSDQNNKDVLQWLDRLQDSVRSARATAASSAPTAEGVDSDHQSPADDATGGADRFRFQYGVPGPGSGNANVTHAQRYGLVPPSSTLSSSGGELSSDDGGGVSGDETEGGEDDEESRNELHVPLKLIKNLSLSSNPTSRKFRERDRDRGAGKEGSGTGMGAGTSVGKESGGSGQAAGGVGKDGSAKAVDDSEGDLDDDNVGVANETYFLPGPATDLDKRAMLIEQHSPPEILVHGLVGPEDVDRLFEIFYEKVNPFVGLLDPVLHTPALTFARCPFLFTVICAVSSRYYPPKAEIYPIAMHFAKHSAATALIDGWKSVELCQAYILMSVYAVPARRWEEDRSWLYTGLAIRIAMDLNLHQVQPSSKLNLSEKQEREILNKTRVWMICFNLDRSTATQFGKPFTIKQDHIVLACGEYYKRSQFNDKYDVHLCGYTALLRILTAFHEEIFSDPTSPTGLNKAVDFRTVTLRHDACLTEYHEEWSRRFAEHSDPNDDGCKMRCLLLPFLVSYSRLVMFSFGFQQAFQRGMQDGDGIYFTKCLDSAKVVIRTLIEKLVPTRYLRYAPDGHFIFASFASAFLLKLLRPECASMLAHSQENEIFQLIGRLIQTLSDPEVAIDDRHTPKLYARFLAGLLSRHKRDGTGAGRGPMQNPPMQQMQTDQQHQQAPGSGSGYYGQSTFSFGNGGSGQPPSSGPYQFGGAGGPSGYHSSQASTSSPPSTGLNTPSTATAVSFSIQPETPTTAKASDMHMPPELQIDETMYSYDGGMMSGPLSASSDEEASLAAMQALKNPAWWNNMMMPGFSWPDNPSPPSTQQHHSMPPQQQHPHQHQQHMPVHSGSYNDYNYGTYQTQVPIA